MYGKIEITGTIEILTGMHIGGNGAFAAIGAVDSPVIKDPVSGMPIIPGSSLKGKMRSLLAKQYNTTVASKPDEDNEILTNLFGSSKKGNIHVSRILFSDALLSNWDELKGKGLTSRTEVKFENSINRLTAVANPRQIERVVRGSKFPMCLIYEVDDKISKISEEDVIRDMKILRDGFKLLEMDYLGGNGSRGYGRIKIEQIKAQLAVGDLPDALVDQCCDVFNEV